VGIYTTEITSDKIQSDNPIHQRLLKAYYLALPFINGDVLELGVGEGRGLAIVGSEAKSFTAVDKIGESLERLRPLYPDVHFIKANIPPLKEIESGSFDVVISFQVIEHIRKDKLFLEEIARVLRPGGKCLITTPNRKMSLTRNPWHVREYTSEELSALGQSVFGQVIMKGITGSPKVWKYYQQNKESVEKLMRFDVLDLQHRLPASLLKIPYEIMNRLNRNKLKKGDEELVAHIGQEDYLLSNDPATSLDLFMIATL